MAIFADFAHRGYSFFVHYRDPPALIQFWQIAIFDASGGLALRANINLGYRRHFKPEEKDIRVLTMALDRAVRRLGLDGDG